MDMAGNDTFLKKTLLQAEINRLKHGDAQKDDLRPVLDWALIAGEHMGHLLGAVRENDLEAVEKELLHVAAPLMELHNALQREQLGKTEKT
ncbi:hypothetical protein Pmgp_02275 [Pelotomaculum propionicicum]|uniref:Uncharacterized protein n=2 Tax=Pelotomaculum propionicicum TaxID=258475 RepID=A0A4Y7RNN3_9FIRM|nr:hypothetical protein Pmgp_02275 [Pelotomaculum propionicicum]